MRLVSLVPSLTETVHDFGLGGHVVGVTKFCVRPEEARLTARVIGGTKDPDVAMILGLRPDLVLADEDENQAAHVAELRAAGVRVHVTRIETVADVCRELRTLGDLLGRSREAETHAGRIQERAAALRAATRLVPSFSCFVPIWKKPLMTMGGRTYMSDLLSLGGAANAFAENAKKYFQVEPDEVLLRQPDAILLPTEPYRFQERDRGEFSRRFDVPLDRVRVVDGQAFTWFGTHTWRGLEAIPDAVSSVGIPAQG